MDRGEQAQVESLTRGSMDSNEQRGWTTSLLLDKSVLRLSFLNQASTFRLESILGTGTSILDSYRSLERSLPLSKIEAFSYLSEEGFNVKVSAPKGLLKTSRFFPF